MGVCEREPRVYFDDSLDTVGAELSQTVDGDADAVSFRFFTHMILDLLVQFA